MCLRLLSHIDRDWLHPSQFCKKEPVISAIAQKNPEKSGWVMFLCHNLFKFSPRWTIFVKGFCFCDTYKSMICIWSQILPLITQSQIKSITFIFILRPELSFLYYQILQRCPPKCQSLYDIWGYILEWIVARYWWNSVSFSMSARIGLTYMRDI